MRDRQTAHAAMLSAMVLVSACGKPASVPGEVARSAPQVGRGPASCAREFSFGEWQACYDDAGFRTLRSCDAAGGRLEAVRGTWPAIVIMDERHGDLQPIRPEPSTCGAGPWRGRWKAGDGEISVEVLETPSIEVRSGEIWFIRRIEVRGLGPGLEGTVGVPVVDAGGKRLWVEVQGARVEPASGSTSVGIPLVRDEDLVIATRVSER